MPSSKLHSSKSETREAEAAPGGGYVPLPLVGQIREKGFASSSKHWNRVSPPESRATPFPIAHHRSDGPHWAPPSAQNAPEPEEVPDDIIGEHLAANAQPLVRKEKKAIDFSKWRTEKNGKAALNLVRTSDAENNIYGNPLNLFSSKSEGYSIEKDSTNASLTSSNEPDSETISGSKVERCANLDPVEACKDRLSLISSANAESKIESPSGPREDVEGVNEVTLQSMTNEQIVAAQQELAERFRPDILDMLRSRGKKKAEVQKSSTEKTETSTEKGSLSMSKVGKVSIQEHGYSKDTYAATIAGMQGSDVESSTSVTHTDSADHIPLGSSSWPDRVEAVRLFKFGLDGNFVGIGSATVPTSTGDNDNQLKVLNVMERDFLRMEGDPASDGYTIKEAVALARSMVPAQRSAALRLLGNILDKALLSLQSACNRESCASYPTSTQSVDWQAVWAYALGPDPELVLTLRMALDDSHATAVLTCSRALEFLLSSSANEHYFNLCELAWPGDGYLFTAPIFQKPSFQESGLIGDCHWKYNVKPSDMFPFSNSCGSESEEGDSTVKEDALIAKQDVAAGLIRMGILPRVRYLLEVERLIAAEDSLFSILIALARHSPAAADAVMKCPRLMDTILQLFVRDETMTWPARPKAIKLLKVLSTARKSACIQLVNMGLFQASQLGLLRQGLTLGTPKRNIEGYIGSWVGLVESLNFWRICIKYRLGISCFSDFYPALLFWISTPHVQQPMQKTVDFENATLAESSFQLLDALASTLPILHGINESEVGQDMDINDSETFAVETNVWSWKFAIPIVENSIGWLSTEFIHSCTQNLQQLDGGHKSSKLGVGMLLRTISSVLHFLSTVCGRILEEGNPGPPWLPTFVPKLALQLVRSGLLGFNANGNSELGRTSFVECFLCIKEKVFGEDLLEVTNCLHGLVRLLKVLDRLLASVKIDAQPSRAPDESLGIEETLRCGLAMSAKGELMRLLRYVGDDLIRQSGVFNMVDTTRRGGPAPGIGIGWGCQGGGYWSCHVLTAQVGSVLVVELIELFFPENGSVLESLNEFTPGELLHPDETGANLSAADKAWKIKVGLSVSLLAGPHNTDIVERVCCGAIFCKSSLNWFLKQTGFLLRKWIWKLEIDDRLQETESYLSNLYSKMEEIAYTLLQHVRSVWFQRKMKPMRVFDKKTAREVKSSKRGSTLSTVHEVSTSLSAPYGRESLAVEWAGQKLPLPSFWFLSPLLSNVGLDLLASGNRDDTKSGVSEVKNLDVMQVIRHGLLLLFGLEALEEHSPHLGFHIPIARKIHALSNVFLLSDDIFLENVVRSMIGALQELYVYELEFVSEQNQSMEDIDPTEHYAAERSLGKDSVHSLDFEGLVDERYSSFVDNLTNQFASVSYGDLVFSRQVAIYLRRDVSDSLRLRVWKSLESEHVLEFLPPLEQCCGHCTVYLYPLEENQELLKSYASAWASGALDRARARNSASFSLALFHVASFIFNEREKDQKLLLRKVFAKSLVLGLARRPQLQESLLQLLNCNVPVVMELRSHGGEEIFRKPSSAEIKLRCVFLEEVCAEFPELLAQIQLLKSS